MTLEEFAIGISILEAHSTHGVSVSAAVRAGITTEDILNPANWSSKSVFLRLYHKSIDKAAYVRPVISQISLE